MAKTGYYCSGRFTQRIRRNYSAADGLANESVNCLLLHGKLLYAGTDDGLFCLEESTFVPVFQDTLTERIGALAKLDSQCISVASGNNVYLLEGGSLRLFRQFEEPVVEVQAGRGLWWILTKTQIFAFEPNTTDLKLHRHLEGGEGLCMAVSDENLYVATQTNISYIHGKRNEWKNILPDFCNMPKEPIHALCFDTAGHLWVGMENGVAIYDNGSLWITSEKLPQLPKNTVYAMTADRVGGRYFASDVGVILLKNGKTKYLSADRWVPDNTVRDVAVSDDGERLFAATAKGIAEISCCEMSLQDKAAYHEEIIETYHIRRGFVSVREKIENYELSSGIIHISDNDGLWTASNVAAEAFRFGATGNPDALRKARRGMQALLLLTQISGIPGFTARAVRYPGESGYGDGNHERQPAPDGSCEWKCETSSDEMTGHFFGLSVYYDLCADDREKEQIRKALCAIMDHIIDNDYRLIDHDGKPTTWAVWDPSVLNHDDKWIFERGINSLELLAFLKVSYHVSGNRKYAELYEKFVRKHHYALNASRHKIRDAHICHIDDNLGFLAALTLLRLEDDPAIRALILCGLEDHWQYERVERQPMFSFIHAIFTGNDADLLEGIQSLREYPLDMVNYAVENSKRKDLVFDTEQEAWHEPAQTVQALPFDERNVRRPDASCFVLDEPNRHCAEEGTFFLLPYWIARYYDILREAESYDE